MSHHATTRAWESGARGNDMLVLLALADFAGGYDDPYDFAYPAVPTLASKTGLSARTVQRCLRSLEDQKVIKRTGEHTWKPGKVTAQYRLTGLQLGGKSGEGASDRQGRQSDTPDSDDTGGVTHSHPTLSVNPVQTERSARAREDRKTQIPDGFPDELRPHAREAMRILKAVAADHPTAKAVWPREVGLVIMAFPRRPLVAAAHELARWAVDPPRPIRDVAATYRTFLKGERDLESTERLAADGTPTTEGAASTRAAAGAKPAWGVPRPGPIPTGEILAMLNAAEAERAAASAGDHLQLVQGTGT